MSSKGDREHPTDRKVYTKLSAYQFIAQLIQHIPAKGLKLVRHYGLYARCKFKKVKQIIDKIFKFAKAVSQEFIHLLTPYSPTNYRGRLINSFKIDPFRCPHCGSELILYQVWHPDYGLVYDICRDENWQELDTIDVVEEEKPKEQRPIKQDSQLYLFEMQPSN